MLCLLKRCDAPVRTDSPGRVGWGVRDSLPPLHDSSMKHLLPWVGQSPCHFVESTGRAQFGAVFTGPVFHYFLSTLFHPVASVINKDSWAGRSIQSPALKNSESYGTTQLWTGVGCLIDHTAPHPVCAVIQPWMYSHVLSRNVPPSAFPLPLPGRCKPLDVAGCWQQTPHLSPLQRQLCLYSLNKYLLPMYCVPRNALGTWAFSNKAHKCPILTELSFQ